MAILGEKVQILLTKWQNLMYLQNRDVDLERKKERKGQERSKGRKKGKIKETKSTYRTNQDIQSTLLVSGLGTVKVNITPTASTLDFL